MPSSPPAPTMTARYFEFYFGKKPHLIRRNRTSVAVLTGQETGTELAQLGPDIFQYYGLGCRNVSKLFVPTGYDFVPLLRCAANLRGRAQPPQVSATTTTTTRASCWSTRVPHLDNGFLLLTQRSQAGVAHLGGALRRIRAAKSTWWTSSPTWRPKRSAWFRPAGDLREA
ncbi:MAG: hypothetical protein WKG07_33720 [Hymenobacter sp.]